VAITGLLESDRENQRQPISGDVHQFHAALLPGLKAHGGARGDVQAHATRGGTIEIEGRIGFRKVIV